MKNFKQILGFALSICSILVMALFFSNSYPDSGKFEAHKTYLFASDGYGLTVSNVNYIPLSGNLPDLIRVPEPAIREISQPAKNDPNRDKENRELNAKVYKDLESKSEI